MPRDEIGEINYFLSNHLNWHVPRFSDLLRGTDSRIWSPEFGKRGERGNLIFAPADWRKCHVNTNHLYPNLIKLSISSEADDDSPADRVRVVVTDESGNEINICECTWNSSWKGFEGISLLNERELLLRETGEIPNGYLRLYCENSQDARQVTDAATQTECVNCKLIFVIMLFLTCGSFRKISTNFII